MKLTFDTNVLIRLFVADHPHQLARATALLREAESIAIPTVALCETVWVLQSAYRITKIDIADKLERFLADERVRCDQDMAVLGVACLRKGGDFADAVIAAEGRRLGADSLATFDRPAARLLEAAGEPVTLLD